MKLRVARIPFLNCNPFYADWDDTVGDLIPAVPRQLGQLATQGLVDAGPMAVSDYFRLEDRFEPLNSWGIAVGDAAESVLLFARDRLPSLQGKTIGVTEATSTSIELLKLILESRHHVFPRRYRVRQEPEGDGILMIGDDALRAAHNPSPRWSSHPFLYDLGTEWWEWQQLPFVFAVWVTRKGLPPDVRGTLAMQLDRAVTEFWRHPARYVEDRSALLGIPVARLIRYLERMRHRLTPEDEQGMARFRKLSVVAQVPPDLAIPTP